MDDYNVIQVLDKIKKEIERGALPLAVSEIDSTMLLLDRKIAKGNGKRFSELHIPQDLPTNSTEAGNKLIENDKQIKYKINEVIRFLNERFPLH